MWAPFFERLQKTAHRSLPPSLRQFVKFGIAGTFGFVVDISVYLSLTRLLQWTTVLSVLGYEIIAPNLVSVLAAMVAVFLLNKYWTFRDPRPEELARQGARFFGIYLTTYILNQIITSFFAFRVHILQSVFGPRTDIAAKIIAIGIILFVNFVGSKFLVFRHAPAANVEAS